MTTPSSYRRRRCAVITGLAMLLAACGTTTAADGDSASSAAPSAVGTEATDSAFPRTVDTEIGPITIDERPERIVAASTNAAEIALALVGPERVIGVPTYNLEDRHSPYAAEARQVATTVQGTASDPEQLLALEPDLVLITLAHDSEDDALELLRQAGVPTLVLGHHPHVVDDVYADVTLIGEALGAEEEAAAYVAELQERFAAVDDLIAESDTEPRVVYISMWLDSGPYVTGPGTINHDLVLRTGSVNAIERAGFTSSDYLDVEQLVAAAPTHIVTTDPAGDGLAALTNGFLDNPALEHVPAIAENRILVLPPRYFSASRAGIDGFEAMAAWLADPDATTTER